MVRKFKKINKKIMEENVFAEYPSNAKGRNIRSRRIQVLLCCHAHQCTSAIKCSRDRLVPISKPDNKNLSYSVSSLTITHP
jgi:hypothetical protein